MVRDQEDASHARGEPVDRDPGAAQRGLQWLATEDALRRWMSPDLEVDLRVGGSYRLRGPDGETWISGTILEIVSEGRLVLSWFEEGSDWVHPARLVVTLSPVAEGTRVDLIHDGFAGIGKPNWPATVEGYERGADRHAILEQLATLAAGSGA